MDTGLNPRAKARRDTLVRSAYEVRKLTVALQLLNDAGWLKVQTLNGVDWLILDSAELQPDKSGSAGWQLMPCRWEDIIERIADA